MRPRHKRLLGVSPCPYTCSLVSGTPSSVCRRSSRLADQLQSGHVQMYSPFCIVTPCRTPNKIRMGIHEPKRSVIQTTSLEFYLIANQTTSLTLYIANHATSLYNITKPGYNLQVYNFIASQTASL